MRRENFLPFFVGEIHIGSDRCLVWNSRSVGTLPLFGRFDDGLKISEYILL